ncbi:hypothetical protein Kpho02_77610 [Kitasatospora phosalacinea]|uniref:Uncharacterized protein n=1 Tax=Kitasatospora phosalacinea TaxID=2065 RepID=A0A9W6QG31_9ACTN|nr:hypothetical protein [Kitasatospora phosalacinea]GLW75464.1 hypothetical protein Kpho02_77610 [Kitasatospora phosalacinea]
MIGLKDVRRWIDSAIGQAMVTAGMGLLVLWPSTGSQRLVYGVLFVLGVLNLLLMVLGPWLVRRAAAKGRLRGRHSRT